MSVAIFFGLFIVVVYLVNKYLFSYWSNRGFPQLNPSFLFGDAGPLIKAEKCFGEFFRDLYFEHKDKKVLGIYLSYRRLLMVTDPVIVQDIMIKDFTSFHDRPIAVDEEKDPLSGHLFNIAGQRWRDLRAKLSPTFTSGKLKGMFPVIRDCGKVLDEYLAKNIKNGIDVFEFRDLMARFNTNIISSVAFGMENDCINKRDHIFHKMGLKFFESNFKNSVRNLVAFIVGPKVFHKIGFKSVDDDVEDFIFAIVQQTVELREQKNFSRNDFIQLLLQLKNQGYVSVDKGEKEVEVIEDSKKLSINQLAANVFVFFIAGFETSSSTMSFCIFELARNPKLQRKVQEEIDRVFGSAGTDAITYDMMSEMKYLECCVDETLRKYPIFPIHFRTATRDYKIANSDLVIPKDTAIFIPSFGFHRDPEIYDNPLEFRPDRFLNSPNGGGKVKGVFYTPFGDGPRNCIGMRLGKLTTKLGLALILSKFDLELNDKSMINGEPELHPRQYILTPLKPFDIKITPRKKHEE